MGTDCDKTKHLISLWEQSGEAAGRDVQAITEHLSTCPSCRGNYAGLLPLIRRDSALSEENIIPEPHPDEELIERITKAIAAETVPAKPVRHRAVWVLGTAAAAVMVILALVLLPRIDAPGRGGDSVLVHFTLTAPEAESVVLVGDFTDWDEKGIVLEDRDKDGVWDAEIRLKKGAIYKYNFVMDGDVWIADPGAQTAIDDGFGGSTSLLQI